MHHFESWKILTDFQHGFRKARSCESQLIITVDDLDHNLGDDLQTDLILLDFSKAFDKVPHLRLLHKLKYYGINGSLLSWIGNSFQGRVQKVVLDGESSDQSPLSSEVPQGTVLGPLLFLAYINEVAWLHFCWLPSQTVRRRQCGISCHQQQEWRSPVTTGLGFSTGVGETVAHGISPWEMPGP